MTVDLAAPDIPEIVRDLWRERRVGTLGVVRRDGSPHLTPVKSMLDGSRVLVLTRPATVKARAVARSARASVAEHTPTAAWGTLEGPARLSQDPRLLVRARRLYAERYGADDHWGTCVLVIEVDRVLTGS